MAINIDIRGWIAGTIITVMGMLLYFSTTPVIIRLKEFAGTQDIGVNAWNVINLIVGFWQPICMMISLSGIIYIIYSSIRKEVETRYGGF